MPGLLNKFGMNSQDNGPPRLLDSISSPLGKAALQAGRCARSEGGSGTARARQASILLALGVGSALSTSSKLSWAAAITWKKAVVVGAFTFGGAGAVVAYQSLTAPASVQAESGSATTTTGAGLTGGHNQGSEATSQTAKPSVKKQAARGTSKASNSAITQTGGSSTPGVQVVHAPNVEPQTAAAKHTSPAAQRAPLTNLGSKSSVKSSAANKRGLADEVALLDRARSGLRGGNAGLALKHLSDHSRQFPAGALRLEAEVLRIEALTASGRHNDAARRARRILARAPKSVVAARLQQYAGKPTQKHASPGR